jgi:hypothetical protein
MFAGDILQLLRRRPFEPFRLVMDDGVTYEVRHPENVIVTMTSAVVGYPGEQPPGINLRFDVVALEHVSRLEPLEQPAAKGGNGAG